MILTWSTSQNDKQIVYNNTFARPFAANEWAPHLPLCCVSRLSRRACCVVLPDKRDTSRHDFFLCQNAWARWRVVTSQVEFGLYRALCVLYTKSSVRVYDAACFLRRRACRSLLSVRWIPDDERRWPAMPVCLSVYQRGGGGKGHDVGGPPSRHRNCMLLHSSCSCTRSVYITLP